jgi:hypothetical protein
MANQHGGRRTRYAGNVVVLRQPEALVAPLLGVVGKVKRVTECVSGVSTFSHMRQIQDRKRRLGKF